MSWLMLVAAVGPLGPTEDGLPPVAEDDLPSLSRCDATWPYALTQLPDSDLWYRFVPEHAWGSPTMVELLIDAAERVALDYPDSEPLLVGDIAKRRGGDLPPHRTHGDGLSADIGLFGWEGAVDDLHGGFPKLSPDDLDVERTWTVIEALIASGMVEHILLDQGHIDRIKAWLLETGRRTPAQVERIFPGDGVAHPWSMVGIVRHAPAHREHLHVRVRCDK